MQCYSAAVAKFLLPTRLLCTKSRNVQVETHVLSTSTAAHDATYLALAGTGSNYSMLACPVYALLYHVSYGNCACLVLDDNVQTMPMLSWLYGKDCLLQVHLVRLILPRMRSRPFSIMGTILVDLFAVCQRLSQILKPLEP